MRILWVSNHTPFLTDFGGGQRSNLIFRTLRTIAEVDVLLLVQPMGAGESSFVTYGTPDGLIETVTPMSRGERCPWSVVRQFAPSLVDKLAYNVGSRAIDYTPNPTAQAVFDRLHRERHYDLFVGRHLKYSGQVGLLKRHNAIVDVDDNDIELYKWIIRAPSTRPLRRLILKQRVRTLERLFPKLLADGPRLWVVKDEDRKLPGFEAASILPNIPFSLASSSPPSPLPAAEGIQRILFVGMLSYIYNREGIEWFLSRVWPSVHAENPRARFKIVGSRLRPEDRSTWSAIPGVEVVGFVDDLAATYRDCSFAIVPVWSGGGTNIKIIEALMYGRTCVLSEPAYRGYHSVFGDRDALIVSRNAGEMIQHCLDLLSSPSRCMEMGARGAALANQHYSFGRFKEIVLDTVALALKARSER